MCLPVLCLVLHKGFKSGVDDLIQNIGDLIGSIVNLIRMMGDQIRTLIQSIINLIQMIGDLIRA